MTYKLNYYHAAAIRRADAELDAAKLPAYSEVLTMLLELADTSTQREAFKTAANSRKIADLHNEIRLKLAPFYVGQES